MTPTITPEVARLAEEAKPLFKSMVEGYYAKIRAGFEIEKILGWEWDTIAGIGFDHYDESFEIYAPEDCVDAAPTLEQHQAIMALGCHQYWINFADGTERFCQGERKQGNGRWRKYDEGERLERRAALAKQDAAPTSASTVPAEALLEIIRDVDHLLTNLQPHIPQACHPGREGFIDNYIDPALEKLRSVLPEWITRNPGACSVTDGEAKK